MWMKTSRVPRMVTGAMLIILFVSLTAFAQLWMSGYIKLTAYHTFELIGRAEHIQESVQRSLEESNATKDIPTRVPTKVSTGVPSIERQKAEPEKGLYNFTVVTAMMDIGRGSWKSQRRTYEQYLSYMEQVLKLEVNMVVYIDEKGKSHAERMRRGKEKHTRIILTSLVDLPYYRYRDRMAEIMDSEEYKKDNELVAMKVCESYSPEYDIVQLSKLYFINRTIWENPFSTSYFMWMDGGYGHGHDIFPQNYAWIPKNLFEFSDKVTFMELRPGVKPYEKHQARLHKMSIAVLPGGFFGGGAEALKELSKMQRDLVDVWMKTGVVDDDQTTYLLIYYKKPSLFHLVPADWYDVFKVFNNKSTTENIKT